MMDFNVEKVLGRKKPTLSWWILM